MRKIDVFFYGLFMDEQLLISKGVTPTNIRSASLMGFQLRIGKRATLIPDQASRVYGIVMSLTQTDIEQLYSDPSVRAYRPEAVIIQISDDTQLPALCFNLVEPPAADEHNAEYASKLRSLAERLQFPTEYISSIQ
jgi:hypothetical protein